MRETRASILNDGPEIVATDVFARGGQLVQAQLHPQLGRLVDDDEQHLVVLDRDRALRAQELLEPEVLAVALRLAEIPVDLLVGEVDAGVSDAWSARGSRALVAHAEHPSRHALASRAAARGRG